MTLALVCVLAILVTTLGPPARADLAGRALVIGSNKLEVLGRRVLLTQAQLPAPTSNERRDCHIKGNVSAEGERIYHVPGGQYYDRTRIDPSKGERWFCTEAEAQAAGWRRSLR